MDCLLVKVFKRYQPYFSTLLCLKKSIRESAFREDIIVIVIAFSEDRCIIPNQIELIHTYFLFATMSSDEFKLL